MSEVKFVFSARGIGTLTINRPQVRNALNFRTQQSFAEAIKGMVAMPYLRVVIITGVGNAFIAGADFSELQDHSEREDGERLTEIMGDALMQLEQLPAITVSVINGPARGGGAEVALACDIRLMAEDADIAFVHSSLGLIPGWGGALRLFREIGYSRAIELLASARPLSAKEAYLIGLVNAVFPSNDLMSRANALANQIIHNDMDAVQKLKGLLQEYRQSAVPDAFDKEKETFIELWDRYERRELFKKL